jgi:hypothetical protein
LAGERTAGNEELPELGEPEGPHRLCAATREQRPVDELIRFVAAPSGEIVPDLSAKLPGRGVWLTGRKDIVSGALAGKVFARSLKRQVTVPADLAERIETLLADRAQQALSLANKAGLVATGFEQVDALIESGGAALLIHARDASAGGKERLDRKYAAVRGAKGQEFRILGGLDSQQLSLALGRASVVHAALKPGGAAEKFASEAGRLERYRSETRSAAAACRSAACPETEPRSDTV